MTMTAINSKNFYLALKKIAQMHRLERNAFAHNAEINSPVYVGLALTAWLLINLLETLRKLFKHAPNLRTPLSTVDTMV